MEWGLFLRRYPRDGLLYFRRARDGIWPGGGE